MVRGREYLQKVRNAQRTLFEHSEQRAVKKQKTRNDEKSSNPTI